MRIMMIGIAVVISCASCSVPGVLEIPRIPGPPDNWSQYSSSTLPESNCPSIEGVYLDSPSIQRLGNVKKHLPEDNHWLFTGYIPLDLAERKELSTNEIDIRRDSFVVRQFDAFHFSLLFLNHQATAVSEYSFSSEKGDYECRDGQMIFPIISYYVMIEGSNLNFQVRNILLKDETGALVIQSTRGPFRGNPAKAEKKFMYEFFRYPQANEVGDD